jgi:4'-phosphopantetheinyl transferase EntD
MTGLLAGLLPRCVAVVETRAELDAPLAAVEEAAIGLAVDARRREFVTGRACARRALRELGLPDSPIPSGSRGEPVWPRGVVGSITHCDGYRACAVAHATDVAALGVDAEPRGPLPPGILQRIATPAELGWLSAQDAELGFDRLLFSAKEAVYKVVFPLTGRSPGFLDVEVSFADEGDTFLARLRGNPSELAGRWTAGDGIVATAIAVEGRRADPPSYARPGRTAGDLSFERTVPRSLVHRLALGEVFVTDSAELAQAEFAVAVQIPRAHSLWFDRRAPFHDPLAAVEAGRQGTFVVAHRHLGVATGLPASLQTVAVTVEDLAAFRDDGTPLEGVFEVRLEDSSDDDSVTRMRFAGRLVLGDRTAMTMAGRLAFLPPADYAALRATQRAAKPLTDGPPRAPRPVEASLVGRFDERNVVIGDPVRDATGWRAPVIVDQRHPAFFDHPQDHMPGPLIVEAYRQTAIVAAAREGALSSPLVAVTSCRAGFADFGEHDGLVECVASVTASDDAGASLSLILEQFGSPIAEAEVRLTPYPRR